MVFAEMSAMSDVCSLFTMLPGRGGSSNDRGTFGARAESGRAGTEVEVTIASSLSDESEGRSRRGAAGCGRRRRESRVYSSQRRASRVDGSADELAAQTGTGGGDASAFFCPAATEGVTGSDQSCTDRDRGGRRGCLLEVGCLRVVSPILSLRVEVSPATAPLTKVTKRRVPQRPTHHYVLFPHPGAFRHSCMPVLSAKLQRFIGRAIPCTDYIGYSTVVSYSVLVLRTVHILIMSLQAVRLSRFHQTLARLGCIGVRSSNSSLFLGLISCAGRNGSLSRAAQLPSCLLFCHSSHDETHREVTHLLQRHSGYSEPAGE